MAVVSLDFFAGTEAAKVAQALGEWYSLLGEDGMIVGSNLFNGPFLDLCQGLPMRYLTQPMHVRVRVCAFVRVCVRACVRACVRVPAVSNRPHVPTCPDAHACPDVPMCPDARA